MWPLMKWDLVEPSRVPPSLTFTMARLPGYYSQTHLSAPKLTVLTIKEECFVLGNARTLKISFLCSSRGTNATIMPVSATSMSRPQKQYKKLTLHCFTHLHMFRFSRFHALTEVPVYWGWNALWTGSSTDIVGQNGFLKEQIAVVRHKSIALLEPKSAPVARSEGLISTSPPNNLFPSSSSDLYKCGCFFGFMQLLRPLFVLFIMGVTYCYCIIRRTKFPSIFIDIF